MTGPEHRAKSRFERQIWALVWLCCVLTGDSSCGPQVPHQLNEHSGLTSLDIYEDQMR